MTKENCTWFKSVIDNIERPIKIYYKNKSAILYAHNNKCRVRLSSISILSFML
jgi:hypothetical protein